MIPKSHPRYESLRTRELIADGIKNGITSLHGLIAHGRGEAFDYLIGEKTNWFAKKSIGAASALLLLARYPVISVNGNAAALVPQGLVELSKMLDAPLEVNIFHASGQREIKIKNHIEKHGATDVLLPGKKHKIKFLESNRKYANKNGILKADAVFVPLEDGDRAEALVKNGKKVITVDLNPLSRTSQKSTITIVDSLTRAMPLLIRTIKLYKSYNKSKLEKQLESYNNKKTLESALRKIRSS